MTQEQKDFINLIKLGAIDTYYKYKVLPSLTIAQSILESAWATSILAKEANNLFGIKWQPNCGYDYIIKSTKEYTNGKWITIDAKFRKYNSVYESILDHAIFLQKSRYAKVLTAKDYKEAAYEVWKAGYATDPYYPNKICERIEWYKLYEVDNMVQKIKDYEDIADWAKEAVLKMIETGIMVGNDVGMFLPRQDITRQEIALIITRLLDYLKY